MPNVIIKSDERARFEAEILLSNRSDGRNPEHRDAAEVIAARTSEAMRELNRQEEMSK
ncbi:hypothetical protein FACS1894217_07260 [Clostridia bacterium]|nr:hypothetical protein FACS1894217_07260 [Clostridia bacterium]